MSNEEKQSILAEMNDSLEQYNAIADCLDKINAKVNRLQEIRNKLNEALSAFTLEDFDID